MVPEREDLLEKLDKLLEKYLGLLDEYENSRKMLSVSMSSVSHIGEDFHKYDLKICRGFSL